MNLNIRKLYDFALQLCPTINASPQLHVSYAISTLRHPLTRTLNFRSMPLLCLPTLIILLLIYTVISKAFMHIRLASLSRFIISRVCGVVGLSRCKLAVDVRLVCVFLGSGSGGQDLDLEFFGLIACVLRLMLGKLLIETV